MGYVLGQKRRKVGRLQRQAAERAVGVAVRSDSLDEVFVGIGGVELDKVTEARATANEMTRAETPKPTSRPRTSVAPAGARSPLTTRGRTR